MRFGALLFGLLLHASTSLLAADTRINKEITLTERSGSELQWQMPIDLGKLKPGEPIRLTLSIKNKTGRTLRFDGFKTSCSCTVGSKIIESLKSGATAKASITITPPKANYRPQGLARFSLYDLTTGQDRVVVDCDYTYERFLGFSQPQYLVKLRSWEKPAKLEPVRLAFRFTAPVQLDAIEVQGTGKFKDIPLSLEASGEGGAVVVPVADSGIPESGLYGTVRITHPTGSYSECQLNVTRQSELDFSPQNVSFVFDEENESFAATGIVVLNRNPNGRDFLSEDAPLALRVSAKASFHCDVTSTMLDKVGRIHRIYFKSEVENLDLIEDLSILLVFEFEKKRYTRKCKVRFIK